MKTPRLPQRRRVPEAELPSFRLTTRDEEILRVVLTFRALTTKQISDLCFAPVAVLSTPQPSSRCLHRLKLLYQHRFLTRTEQPHYLTDGRKPFVYGLDTRGAEFIALRAGCDPLDLGFRSGEAFSQLFLDHLLTTNDVRISVVRSARRHNYTIPEWIDDKALKQNQNKDTVVLTSPNGKKQSAAVVPDGFFVMHTGTHHYHHFLEVDLATVTGSSSEWGRRTWARKVAAYLEYYHSGKYHERYHTKSMRVLTVTTGQKRLANLLHITEESGGKGRFWYTTLRDVQTYDVLVDPIWRTVGHDGIQSLVW